MATVKVLTRFAKKRDDELGGFAHVIVERMTDNVNFPNPTPPLVDVSAAVAAYEIALANAGDGGKQKTAFKNEKRAILIDMLNSLALYVQANCKNDLSILLSSGFNARKEPSPVGMLPRPENFKIENGPIPGSMMLRVDRISGANGYLFEYAPFPVTDETRWVVNAVPGRSFMISGLTGGIKYSFRVAGMGAYPIKVYSDMLSRYAQ